MIDLERYKSAFASMPDGILRAEVNAERIHSTTVWIAQGRASSSEAYDQTKYYLRAGGDRLGMVYTERQDDDVLQLMRMAAENSKWVDQETAAPMHDAADSMVLSEGSAMEPVEDMIRVGQALEAALSGCEIRKLAIRAMEREMRTVNSLGFDAQMRTYWVDVTATVAMKRENMQDAEIETNQSAGSLRELNVAAFAEKAHALCDGFDAHGLSPVTIPGGRHDCVMTGQVMRNILMTAWKAFSAEAMHNGTSCFSGAGQRLGVESLQLINAPRHPVSGKVWPMDSEGSVVPETYIVRDGVLEEPLYTLQSGVRDGAGTNGCAGRVPSMTGNVPIALTTVPAMLYLAPASGTSQDDLIRSMGTGVVLTYSLDLFHSVNTASGLFSVPCGGYYVRDGKPVGSVSQMTVAGSLGELFGAMQAFADDLDFDDFYFRNYCIGSPSVLLKGLSFAT